MFEFTIYHVIAILLSFIFVLISTRYKEIAIAKAEQERKQLRLLRSILKLFDIKIRNIDQVSLDDVLQSIDNIKDDLLCKQIKREIFYSELNPRLRMLA